MKLIIQIAAVALIVGSISAGGSYFMNRQAAKPATVDAKGTAEKNDKQEGQTVESADKPEGDAADQTSVAADSDEKKVSEAESVTESAEPKPEASMFGPPVAFRPPFDPNGDEAGDLIHKLRMRLASTSRQERRIAEREEAMKLIVDDLRSEQTKAAKLRKKILDEQNLALRAIDEARQSIDSERTVMSEDLAETRRLAEERIQSVMREKEEVAKSADEAIKAARNEQDDLRKQLEMIRNPPEMQDRSGTTEQTANLKKAAEVLNSTPPEDTAKMMQESVLKGRTEAVIALLDAMKPRVVSKVISAISESQPELAADLIDRLKRRKKEAEPPVAMAK